MERQTSFAQAEYAGKKKTTRRERFLGEMEQVVPWVRLVTLLTPFYPKGERGRPPMGVEKMLRVYFLQQWYALADEALEDALYDSQALRAFAGIDLAVDAVPDATTLLGFRHLLERQGLTKRLLEEVSTLLAERGVLLREGTMVDATIIAAPSSTKNASHRRDPEMHQTKKGNVWHFGLKAHIGCDVDSGVVHSLAVTAANVADVVCTPDLLHGQEQSVFGDAGYTGADKHVAMRERKLRWQIALKRGQFRRMTAGPLKAMTKELEKLKAQVRARVEHPFHVVKNLFGYRKTRYRGLAKNTAQLHTLFALANLVLAKRALLTVAVG